MKATQASKRSLEREIVILKQMLGVMTNVHHGGRIFIPMETVKKVFENDPRLVINADQHGFTIECKKGGQNVITN
jgi:hypothetical protein